jgi:hypothetical protein
VAVFRLTMANMMHTAARPTLEARRLILDALQQRPHRPAELLEKLHSSDVTVARLKNELAMLVDEKVIELSPDRYIRLCGPESTAAV